MLKLNKLFMKGITLIIAFGMICVSNSTEIFASESEPCTESSRTVYYNAYTQALQEAEETGSENEIEKTKNEFSDYVYDLQKNESDETLSNMGYNQQQINLIRQYDGSQDIIALFSGSVTITNKIENYKYNSSTKQTSADIAFTFTWNGTSAYNHKDVLAVAWSEGLYTNSKNIKITCTYKSNRNNTKISFSAPSSSPYIAKNVVGTGNQSAKFTFDKHYGSRMCLYSATGKVHVTKKAKVPEFSSYVSYGETKTNISPSFSVSIKNLSISISFKKNISEIASKRCYKKL